MIIITAGGTGGHIIPAQAFADNLIRRGDQVFFIGGKLDENSYFDRNRFPFAKVSCSSFSWRSPWKACVGIYAILRGFFEAKRLLKKLKPRTVVGFGSYHTLPVILAARWLKIPLILHEGNSIPGRVNRFASRFANMTGVHFPEAKRHLKGPCEEVPLPHKKDRISIPQDDSRTHFSLKQGTTTLLILGGSQGANVLNEIVPQALAKWKEDKQVIHLAGRDGKIDWLKAFYEEQGIAHCVLPFCSEMEFAWQAADLVIARSGAATLAEMELYGVPGVLIPYPQAMDNHQWHNARYLEKLGGAVVLEQKKLNPDKLGEILEQLFQRRYEMRNILLEQSRSRQKISLEEFVS